MNICMSCGVELEDNLNICPLCGNDPHIKVDDDSVTKNTPLDIIDMHRKERQTNLWELSSVVAFSAIAVCTIVDLVVGPGLRWSLYADTSVLAVWITLTLLHFSSLKPVIRVCGIMLTILAMLFFFDLFAKESYWFIPVGMPITLMAYLCLGLVLLLRRIANFRGFNLLGIAFLSIAVFCILTEIIIDFQVSGKIDIRWSLIAAISIMPLSIIFFFMHYRMKRGNRLDSFFHV